MSFLSGLGKVFSSVVGAIPGIGTALSIGTGLLGAATGIGQKKEANKINPVYKAYETSQYAKDMHGTAQMRLNARNPQAEAQRRAALNSGANALAGVQRNSTDASQSMAMAGAIQGQTDQSLNNLALQDQANDQAKLANLFQAQNVLIGEDRMKYQDMLTKYQLDMGQKNALMNAGNDNMLNGLDSAATSMIASNGLFRRRATGGTTGSTPATYPNLIQKGASGPKLNYSNVVIK
jgi:hypothetical protein